MARVFRAADWVRVEQTFTWFYPGTDIPVELAYCPRSIWLVPQSRAAWIASGVIPDDTPEMLVLLEELEIESVLIAQGAIDPT